MVKTMSLTGLAAMLCIGAAPQEIGLSPGMVITRSVKVRSGERLVLPPGPAGTCVTIRGENLEIDFNGAYVRGDKNPYHNRESFDGVGLLIEGCKNVTVRNANIQAFRFNIRIVDSENVRIEACDVSFSRAIRMMKDGVQLDTFLNLRDADAWRRYGAGIWIEKSRGCSVDRVTGTGALIGVALVDTAQSKVHNSDFSFNGGWGVALARSSENVVSWNRLDFVNRVWGGGWGGDSAAIAVADDSDRNFFVGNSMTHGGDGFFLSNRNDIGPVDPQTGFHTPRGGSDSNVIAYNDGSWSPNNAFEGTFSDGNVYFENVANASGYGFWLGFSTNNLLINNTIVDNFRDGIAIEHGKGNRIEGNKLERNAGAAIRLWASEDKRREPFPSARIDLLSNLIADSRTAFVLTGSTDVLLQNNRVMRAGGGTPVSASRNVESPRTAFERTPQWPRLREILASKPADFKMYATGRVPKGLEWLQPADYGPKDYRGDLAAVRQSDPTLIEMILLEPGVKVVAPDWTSYEDTPDEPYHVRVRPRPSRDEVGEDRPIKLTLTSRDGKRKQVVEGLLRRIVWNLKWFAWHGIRYEDSMAWNRLFAGAPIKSEQSSTLGGDYTGRSPSSGVPDHHFALVATTTIKVPPGRYRVQTVSDDGIRLYIDGRIVIERWSQHGPTNDNVAVDLDAGPHTVRVEYCQEAGAGVLRLDWKKM